MEYHQTSLCKVYTDSKGYKCLERVFDVADGKLMDYDTEDERYPKKSYGNRSKLFGYNIYEEDGSFSVWDWTATQSLSDPEKDHIEVKKAKADAIQWICVSGVSSDKELKSVLLNGFEASICCKKIMLGYTNDMTEIGIGFLVDRDCLQLSDGSYRLDPRIGKLTLHKFSMRIKNYRNVEFLEPAALGNAVEVCVKEIGDIVKQAVLYRASWNTMKSSGVSKKDWQQYRDFFTNLPMDTLYESVAEAASCSVEDAEKHVFDFLAKCDEAFTEDDISDAIIREALERNESFKARTLALLSNEWYRTHQKEVKENEAHLDSLKTEIQKAEDKKNSSNDELKTIEERIIDYTTKMAETERLAKVSEEKFCEKMKAAQEDVAGFIASLPFDMTFAHSGDNGAKSISAFCPGSICSDAINEDWKDELMSVEAELCEAGVNDALRKDFAAFLYGCFINGVPVLLAGPNGVSIANAFSTAVFGHTAGVLSCGGPLDQCSVNESFSSDDQVLIIENPFTTEWLTAVLGKLYGSGKMVFLVHPFAEDLVIEPQGLFNYAVPIFTELLTDRPATDRFVGSERSEDFKEYVPSGSRKHQEKAFLSLHTRPIAKARMQSVLSDAHVLYEGFGESAEYIFTLLPLAFITGQSEKIKELLDESTVGKSEKGDILRYLGIDDE